MFPGQAYSIQLHPICVTVLYGLGQLVLFKTHLKIKDKAISHELLSHCLLSNLTVSKKIVYFGFTEIVDLQRKPGQFILLSYSLNWNTEKNVCHLCNC